MRAVCVRVPAGFCARAGLKAGQAGGKSSASGTWTLGKREAQMLSAVLQAEAGKEVLACPQLVVRDRQGATVQMGPAILTVAGSKGFEQDILVGGDTGLNLTVQPDVFPDGKHVQLKVKSKYCPPCTAGVATADTPLAVSAAEVVVVPSGGTAVLMESVMGKQSGELLWILTAHVVEGRKQPAAGESGGQKPAAPSNSSKE
jgi:hypothetical protein